MSSSQDPQQLSGLDGGGHLEVCDFPSPKKPPSHATVPTHPWVLYFPSGWAGPAGEEPASAPLPLWLTPSPICPSGRRPPPWRHPGARQAPPAETQVQPHPPAEQLVAAPPPPDTSPEGSPAPRATLRSVLPVGPVQPPPTVSVPGG